MRKRILLEIRKHDMGQNLPHKRAVRQHHVQRRVPSFEFFLYRYFIHVLTNAAKRSQGKKTGQGWEDHTDLCSLPRRTAPLRPLWRDNMPYLVKQDKQDG